MTSFVGTYDLGPDGKTILVDLMNATENSNYVVADFVFSDPIALDYTDPVSGLVTNSQIKLTYMAATGNYGVKTIYYNRIRASDFKSPNFKRGNAVKFSDLLAQMNARYGINILPTEVTDFTLPTGDFVTIPFEFIPSSIIYMGVSTLSIGAVVPVVVDKDIFFSDGYGYSTKTNYTPGDYDLIVGVKIPNLQANTQYDVQLFVDYVGSYGTVTVMLSEISYAYSDANGLYFSFSPFGTQQVMRDATVGTSGTLYAKVSTLPEAYTGAGVVVYDTTKLAIGFIAAQPAPTPAPDPYGTPAPSPSPSPTPSPTPSPSSANAVLYAPFLGDMSDLTGRHILTPVGGAIVTNGSLSLSANQYVTAPESADFAFGTDNFSIFFRATKTQNGPNGYDNILLAQPTPDTGWYVELSSTRGFAFSYSNTDLLTYNVGNFLDGIEHTWELARVEGTMTLSKDGVIVVTKPDNTNIALLGEFGIGGNAVVANYTFAGKVRDTVIKKYPSSTPAPSPAPAPAPTPAPSMNIFLDNFNGTGTLASHTSDSGNTYADFNASYPSISLSLNNGLLVTSAGSGATNYSGGAVTDLTLPDKFSMEAIVNIGTITANGYVYFDLDFGLAHLDIQVDNTSIYPSLGTSTSTAGALSTPYVPGIFTFRLDVTPTTREWFINNVSVRSSVTAESMAGTKFGFRLDTASPEAVFQLDSLRIYTEPATPTP